MTGAVVSLEDGSCAQINAKSVVIAAGDYSGNDDMLNYYAPMTAYAMDARWYMPPGCNTGDLLSQAIWAGGVCRSPSPTPASCTSTSAPATTPPTCPASAMADA